MGLTLNYKVAVIQDTIQPGLAPAARVLTLQPDVAPPGFPQPLVITIQGTTQNLPVALGSNVAATFELS